MQRITGSHSSLCDTAIIKVYHNDKKVIFCQEYENSKFKLRPFSVLQYDTLRNFIFYLE